MELCDFTAKNLAKMLRTKECSSVEITKSVFSRINAVEDKIGAYITLLEEYAMQKALEVDRKLKKGETVSAIAGIPIGIKDNICTNGILTTCASKMLSSFVPPYDATVVTKLKLADAVILGKLNLDEFAMGSNCDYSYYKATRNPYNVEYVAGGSSGGSAAAVAAGEAILSLGTDTGGSVRLPASYCGVVGLKPTYGRVSRYGMVAFASSFDQIGPIGKSVFDVAMLYDAICGYDKSDMTSLDIEEKSDTSVTKGVNGVKIGVPKEYFSGGIDNEVSMVVNQVITLLKSNGAIIKTVSTPFYNYAVDVYQVISCAEASSNLARIDGVKFGFRASEYSNLEDLYVNSRSEGFGEEVKRRILLGTFVLNGDKYEKYYIRARKLQAQIISDLSKLFCDVDILLTPTAMSTAFKAVDGEGSVKNEKSDICTVCANIAGLPAISIPCGKSSNNMPIGVQFVGPKLSEQLLFDISGGYEALIGGFKNVLPQRKLGI